MVHEVWARDVITIPARREYDIHENALVALARWERVGQWVGRRHAGQAKVVDGLVRGSRAQRTSGVRAGDHAETRRKLPNVGLFGAKLIVPHAPL